MALEPWAALLAVVAGYLLGSISFARVVTGLVRPGEAPATVAIPLAEGDDVVESDLVSATTVRIQLGTGYGCLVSLLDMAKVALPTLAFRLWEPAGPYFLMAAAAGMVGHIYPLTTRFKGGRGESPLYGGLVVIDPLGVVVTNVAAMVLGLALGHLLVLRLGGMVLMIPWLWLRTGDPAHVAYIALANGLYWFAVRGELRQYARLMARSESLSQEELATMLGVGSRLGRLMDRLNWRGRLVARLRRRVG
jgi:acyl phosphate:glycerol-3-phosphate acyltransferase